MFIITIGIFMGILAFMPNSKSKVCPVEESESFIKGGLRTGQRDLRSGKRRQSGGVAEEKLHLRTDCLFLPER